MTNPEQPSSPLPRLIREFRGQLCAWCDGDGKDCTADCWITRIEATAQSLEAENEKLREALRQVEAKAIHDTADFAFCPMEQCERPKGEGHTESCPFSVLSAPPEQRKGEG